MNQPVLAEGPETATLEGSAEEVAFDQAEQAESPQQSASSSRRGASRIKEAEKALCRDGGSRRRGRSREGGRLSRLLSSQESLAAEIPDQESKP